MEDEEAWDETLMGPKEGDMSVLKTGDTSVDVNPRLIRKQSSGVSGAPPSSLFMQAIQSAPAGGSTQQVAADTHSETSSRHSSMRFEDEEDDEDSYQSTENTRIRQEALRMLEVADDQLTDSNYSVYRTSTGGFTAAPKSLSDINNKRRMPSAVSGLSFATARKNVARPFRDEPYADTEAAPPSPQKDYDYGNDSAVVDMAQMENRSAASRQADNINNNWSSRYSIDTTLLALSGGTVSSSRLLDKMDKENSEYARRTARNMFSASPLETRSPQVFGSGFSFRQKHVFGQQNVTAQKPEPNLNTAFADATEEEAISPARSWQEQFQQQRRNRRHQIIAVGVIIFIIVAICSIMVGSRKKRTATIEQPVFSDLPEDPSVTFYITSDVPLSAAREKTFKQDLQSMSKVAAFLAHLGDTQTASDTKCSTDHYRTVSSILKTSPFPVFIVPGEEDWPNCPDQQSAWQNWGNAFSAFEQYFQNNFDVLRYDAQKENFAFLHKNVLFVGVHETNGRIDDMTELNSRNRRNVEWIKTSFEYHVSNVRALVIFSNGRPEIRENDSFYLGLGEFLFANKVPTAYIHANHENGDPLTYKPFDFEGMDHVIAIQSSLGESNPPLRINVGFDEKNPFIVG
ncbi:hypothetical protein ACA910_020655 [Epithemia clementina (nom. ined.)]